jgi:hypothetical protein
LTLIALCWISMRRALFAHHTGHASGIAFAQTVFWPALALGLILGNTSFGYPSAIAIVTAYAAYLIVCGQRARSALLADLREAAVNRYSSSRASDMRRLGHHLLKRFQILMTTLKTIWHPQRT